MRLTPLKCFIKALLLPVIFMLSYHFSSAQEIKKTRDAGIWMGATFQYKFKKNYTLAVSQDLRLFESFRELDKYITEIGISYKIDKRFKLGANARYFFNKQKDKTISRDFRYNLDFRFKEKLSDKLKIKYRLRFQSAYRNAFELVPEGIKSNLRNKIALIYTINKQNTAYTSAELFREIVTYKRPHFNKIRLLAGNEVETKLGNFDLSFGYERELNSEYPLNHFFGRVYYTFKLKNEK